MDPYSQPSPGIFLYPLFDAATCDAIIAQANEQAAWVSASVQNKNRERRVDTNFRSSAVCFFGPDTDVWQTLHTRTEQTVRPLIRSTWRQDYPKHSDIHVVRYHPGDFFRPHHDSGAYGSGIDNRYFTVVCYLNDDFEGGGTTFPEAGYTARPARGEAVVFPADYLHGGDPVLEGTKYVAVLWYLAPPPIQWI